MVTEKFTHLQYHRLPVGRQRLTHTHIFLMKTPPKGTLEILILGISGSCFLCFERGLPVGTLILVPTVTRVPTL